MDELDNPATESIDITGQPDAEPGLLDIASDLDEGGELDPETQEIDLDAPPAETAPAEDAWKDRKATVSIDGQDVEITVGEALNGYMRQEDYSRKTAELSNQRTEVQTQREHVERELVNRANQLQVLSQALYQELVGDQAALNQLTDNPPEYLRRQAEMSRKSALLSQVQSQQEALRQQAANDQARDAVERTRRSDAELSRAIPEWRDPAKRSAIQKDVANMLTQMGYQPNELAQLSDHRAMLVAYKAALWDKSQAIAAKRTAPTPKAPVKPGTGGQPNNATLTRAQERFRRNPQSVDALADLAMARGGI